MSAPTVMPRDANHIPMIGAYDGSSVRAIACDSNGVLSISHAGDSFKNITTSTTTTVKGSAGTLKRVTVNTGGTGSTAALYDGTATGTLIATIDTTSRTSLEFNAACATKITCVTTGAPAADITVLYN